MYIFHEVMNGLLYVMSQYLPDSVYGKARIGERFQQFSKTVESHILHLTLGYSPPYSDFNRLIDNDLSWLGISASEISLINAQIDGRIPEGFIPSQLDKVDITGSLTNRFFAVGLIAQSSGITKPVTNMRRNIESMTLTNAFNIILAQANPHVVSTKMIRHNASYDNQNVDAVSIIIKSRLHTEIAILTLIPQQL